VAGRDRGGCLNIVGKFFLVVEFCLKCKSDYRYPQSIAGIRVLQLSVGKV